jgi:hypothetical protein
MANEEHLEILKQGVNVWIEWRAANPSSKPELSHADLQGANLRGAMLRGANLHGADLRGANLRKADLSSGVNLSEANLLNTDLSFANLKGANMVSADLRGTNLHGADLRGANLNTAQLSGADFSGCHLGLTTLGNDDLSEVAGLETVLHHFPSTIGIDTLYKSKGKIPESFLRDAGVPDIFITYLPSLTGGEQPIQFYSCFISYSAKDEDLAKRLHSRLRDEHVRVWFAPEEMKGGRKLHEQIDEAIRVYDKLLLVLSEHSIHSEWVMREIRRARKAEREEKRRKLFPIRLCEFQQLQDWECPDSLSGTDLAEEVRQYFIPDFSNWKNHEAFEAGFQKLLRDLLAEGVKADGKEPKP